VELSTTPSDADPMDYFSLEQGLHSAVEKLERRLIGRALAAAGGNRTRTAEILKINRRLLYDKLREYGLE
jgi:DNA-binding NtrC family response regulator